MSVKNILLVEDDFYQAEELSEQLIDEGFNVVHAPSGARAAKELKTHQIDLVLTDLSMPELDGSQLTQKIRREGDIPVIVVSGKDDAATKAFVLDIGADDFLVKPIDIDELLARIRAVFRRIGNQTDSKQKFETICADVEFNRSARLLKVAQMPAKILPRLDSELLAQLLDAEGSPVSREDLSMSILGRSWDFDDRSIDNSVLRLRKLLGKQRNAILSIRGVGYAFVAS